MLQTIPHFLSVNQVAVVSNGDATAGIINHDRLNIFEVAAACG